MFSSSFICNNGLLFYVLAIREDRTRGGRSTYQCSYTLPNNIQPITSLNGSSNTALAIPNKVEGQTRPLSAIMEPSGLPNHESQDAVMSEEEAVEGPPNVPLLIKVSYSRLFDRLCFLTISNEFPTLNRKS